MTRKIVPALAAAALLVIPTLALAEGDQNSNGNPNGWYNQQGQWQGNGRHHREHGDNDRDDRGQRHGDRGNHYGWNNGRGNPHQWYGNGQNGQYGYGRNGGYGGNAQLRGTVGSFSPYNLYLSNGTHVELRDGTVINPRGATPQPGQRVQVIGHWNSDGSYAADSINLF